MFFTVFLTINWYSSHTEYFRIFVVMRNRIFEWFLHLFSTNLDIYSGA